MVIMIFTQSHLNQLENDNNIFSQLLSKILKLFDIKSQNTLTSIVIYL